MNFLKKIFLLIITLSIVTSLLLTLNGCPPAAPLEKAEETIPEETTEKEEAKTTGQIAFTSDRAGNYEIYVMNEDGSEQTRLTDNPANDRCPALSPDGKKIAFNPHRDGNWEIYVMNANGSELINLTNHPEEDAYPDWSPDGKKITFVSNRVGNREIYVMNADGSEQINLTNNPADDRYPAW